MRVSNMQNTGLNLIKSNNAQLQCRNKLQPGRQIRNTANNDDIGVNVTMFIVEEQKAGESNI